MEGILSDRHIVMMGNKESLDFHTLVWMLMTVDVTPADGGDKKWILNRSI